MSGVGARPPSSTSSFSLLETTAGGAVTTPQRSESTQPVVGAQACGWTTAGRMGRGDQKAPFLEKAAHSDGHASLLENVM